MNTGAMELLVEGYLPTTLLDITSSSAPEVTSVYVMTWVRGEVNRA